MQKVTFGDASILFEIARQMKASDDPVHLDWIKSMLQRVAEGDHDGDKELFTKTWLTLERPSMQEHADLIGLENVSYDRPYTDGGRKKLERLDRSWGPNTVEVVRVTDKNMFGMQRNKSQGSEVIAAAHERYGLVLCPPWVSIALCLASHQGSEDKRYEYDQIHVCMEPSAPESDPQILNIIYGKSWWCRSTYGAQAKVDFFPTYLLAKPWK